jgi:glycosyltransferase involved in cell wall biosynthesis
MKACMVSYSFYETDNRVRRYAETLARRGDQVDAIALRLPGQAAFEVIQGVNVYRIQERRIDEKGAFSYLRKLVMFLLRSMWFLTIRHIGKPYALIHVHSVPDFEVFATLVPRLLGARVILDVHDIVPEFYASKFKVNEHSLAFRCLLFLEKISAAYSHHVIIANHLWHKKIIQRSVKPAKCTVILNYPDPSIFSGPKQTPSAGAEFVMCYPGTLNWHQGVDIAIEAVALLRDKAPNLKLLIIGKGPDREKLIDQVKRLGLEDRVTIKGLVPIEEIAKTMSSVDLGVVPKRKDSFGNQAFSTKIMEFMAMGTPVVVSRTEIDQYYFNDAIVEFFDSENVEDLARKIFGLMNNPARRSAFRANALQFIQHNNWDVKKREYLDIVDRMVPQPPGWQQVSKPVGQSR